ncbi:MAG: hypothetical protein U0X20_25030 [Caldilineaceae bacterium]
MQTHRIHSVLVREAKPTKVGLKAAHVASALLAFLGHGAVGIHRVAGLAVWDWDLGEYAVSAAGTGRHDEPVA